MENIEINFKFFTDLYVYQSEQRVNFVYQGTDFVFVCLNVKNNGVYYVKNILFNKDKEISTELAFCNRIEHYWTIYLIDGMEMQLETNGYILFNLYYAEKSTYVPYIKLGIGYITFIKNNNEEFTYKFSDIKKIYRKGNDLHIQHLNYQKTLMFFKSGNEDVIPMLYICNRMFFYKAIELLLGYKL